MSFNRICNLKVLIIAFQVIFFLAQFVLFFPCLVNDSSTEVRRLSDTENPAHLMDLRLEKQSPNNTGDRSLESDWNGSNLRLDEQSPRSRSDNTVEPEGKYRPSWESLDTRPNPSWYDEGKLGIFIHWGVYSVPSNVERGNAEWFWYYWNGNVKNPKRDGGKAKAAQDYMQNNYPPGFQYADFAPKFTAEFFDPNQWAELFQASGAR